MLYLRFIILKRGWQPISRGGEIRFCYMKNWCPSAKEIRTCYEGLPKHCRRIRRVNYAFTTTWHPINYAETYWHGVCKKTVWRKSFVLYGCSFAQRCILKKQSRNRTKTRKNMFFLILFGFYHVFLTGRTAAKNNIQFQPYSSKVYWLRKYISSKYKT